MVKVVDRIEKSEQLLIKQIAAETNRLIQEQNAKIVNLSQGTPNLKIFEATERAMQSIIAERKLPYTDIAGLAKVRSTAAQFIKRFYRTKNFATKPSIKADNIIITAGAVQAVYNVLALSIESTEDVVVSPLPAYGLYKHQTELLGILEIIHDCTDVRRWHICNHSDIQREQLYSYY
jgi:aspartate/methionine/tyrosine aminotransferase